MMNLNFDEFNYYCRSVIVPDDVPINKQIDLISSYWEIYFDKDLYDDVKDMQSIEEVIEYGYNHLDYNENTTLYKLKNYPIYEADYNAKTE